MAMGMTWGDRLVGASAADYLAMEPALAWTVGEQAAQTGASGQKLPGVDELAGRVVPVLLALRAALGIAATAENITPSLQFLGLGRLARDKAMSPLPLAEANLPNQGAVVEDVTALMNPKNPARDDQAKALSARIASARGQVFIVSREGSASDIAGVLESWSIPLPNTAAIVDPAAYAAGGIIDAERMNKALFSARREAFNANSPKDIRYSLVTHDLSGFAGLSLAQLINLILLLPNGAVVITTDELSRDILSIKATALSA
jgi:hypothetical protein